MVKRVEVTDTILFVDCDNIPSECHYDITYNHILLYYHTQKDEPNFTQLTVGGNIVDYPGDGFIYLEICKGMYVFTQYLHLVNDMLTERLTPKRYFQCKNTPGLWYHKRIPIFFFLVVDESGVKYLSKWHSDHLIKYIMEFFPVS